MPLPPAHTATGQLHEQLLVEQGRLAPDQTTQGRAAVQLKQNAAYAQYLVDQMGEQAAFQRLQQERRQLPPGWLPDTKRALEFGTQRRLTDAQIETGRHNRAMESRQAAADAAAASRPQWQVVEGPEGEQYQVDLRGGQKPRPVMLPTAGGPQQAVKRRDLGANELEALRENAQQLAQAMKALGMARGEQVEGQAGDTDATGLKGYVPDIILQRLDSGGVATRAQVGNIGSLRIKQRSGGAVPAAEMARLQPFIPAETDDPDVVREKLGLFINEYAKMLEEDVAAYKASNRRVPMALERFVGDRVSAGRGVMAGRLQAQGALGGAPDPAALLQAIEAELARRRGGR
jgi:hypothetical protein